ncbi:hypothetical protein T492DRAFT_883872, partial [Pavlovales sp. CCMP2436]
PGGIVVYATCSLLPAEGERAVERFLHELLEPPSEEADGSWSKGKPPPLPEMERVPVCEEDVPPELRAAINAEGELRMLPGMGAEYGGMDGFFVSRLRRLS